jgi:G:T-mismatch repair DNA endonuclease (very short patch repair protein)
MPRNNQELWAKKLGSNKTRDKLGNRKLRKMGWKACAEPVEACPRLGT